MVSGPDQIIGSSASGFVARNRIMVASFRGLTGMNSFLVGMEMVLSAAALVTIHFTGCQAGMPMSAG